MEEYQERVVAEKAELDVKRTKLQTFIRSHAFYGIMQSPVSRERFRRQLSLMDEYSAVLAERINSWKDEELSS